MTDSTISAMPPASLPLSDEAVPCVQDGANVQAPAAAFGIPVASGSAPEPQAQFQTWIDTSTSPATLKMYVDSSWVALYRIGTDGALSFSTMPVLPEDPESDYQAATRHYVNTAITGVAGAMVYKGVYNCAGNPNFPAANDGHFYVVGTAGKIGGGSGVNVESGDTLLCRVHGSGAGTYASVGGNWSIGQGNIDRPVSGPASATSGHFASFNGTTGMSVQDSGLSFDTDPAMTANDDNRVPSQRAVKSGIGGKPLSTDTLSQGQGWFWDAVSSTFKARSNEGENLLANSAFDIWQEATSYNTSASAVKTHIADYWKIGSLGGNRTVSRVAGIASSQYAMKVQRTTGSSTAKVVVAQQFSTAESLYLSGKTVTISFDYAVGANYSPGSGPQVVLFYGSGFEEDIDLHATSPAFTTGGGNVTYALTSQVSLTPGVVVRLISPPIAVPTAMSEIALAIYVGGFQGTAGADDSATIGSVKMEIGNIATHYRKPTIGEETLRCLRRFQKSFAQATAPAQNAGALTGEKRWRRFGPTAVSEGLHVQFAMPMRITPTLTFFNPAAANAQVRNETAGSDCTATTAQNVTDAGFEIACTGPAGGAAGDWLGVHWVADSRL